MSFTIPQESHDDNDDNEEEGEDDNDEDDNDDDGDDVHQESSWLMSFTIPQESPHSKLLHSGTAERLPPTYHHTFKHCRCLHTINSIHTSYYSYFYILAPPSDCLPHTTTLSNTAVEDVLILSSIFAPFVFLYRVPT